MVEAKVMTVNRWGAGLGIRLPKEFIDQAGITEKSKIQAKVVADTLVVSALKEPRNHIPLAERLKNWDGKAYTLTDEDTEWLNLKPAGEEYSGE